ncbi:unnamed protein product [Orchesella dallaii]|uniref:C2H2-type domain-containing protein n=1 Tax=Orchesella dallaii TaxID=48710 RepID=A0ABP1RVV1_9HEXA
MTVNVCLVCLNHFENEPSSISSEYNDNNSLLLNRFLKFVQNYLQISSDAKQFFPKTIDIERESFCEKCELAVITPICQVYLEFLSAQLRLSWELGQLARLLDKSKDSAVSELKESTASKMESLSLQLGIEEVSGVNEFRTLLTEKCKLKGKETSLFIPLQRCKTSTTPLKTGFGTRCDYETYVTSLPEEATVPVSQHEHNLEWEKESLYDDNIANDDRVSESLDLEANDSSQLPMDSSPNFDSLESCAIKKEGTEMNTEKRLIKIEIYHDNHEDNSQLLETREEFDIDTNSKLEMRQFKKIQNQENYTCPHCPKKFPQKARLNMHIGRMHPQHRSEKHCKICSISFLTPGRLETHMRQVHGGRPFPCKHCKSSFKLINHLRQHIASVHKPQLCKCKHCGKILKTKRYLLEHIAHHHPQPGFKQSWPKCPKCKKQFFRKDHLQRHVLTCSN